MGSVKSETRHLQTRKDSWTASWLSIKSRSIPKGHFPGEYVDPPFGPPSFTRHYRYNEPALFVEDTWNVTSRLIVTPGLRWEYFGVFHSPGAEHPMDANFYPGQGNNYLEKIANGQILRTVDAPGNLRGHFYLPEYKNFAPRFGAAYDLLGDGKTVIRAGPRGSARRSSRPTA